MLKVRCDRVISRMEKPDPEGQDWLENHLREWETENNRRRRERSRARRTRTSPDSLEANSGVTGMAMATQVRFAPAAGQ